jgi:hypothetical protein
VALAVYANSLRKVIKNKKKYPIEEDIGGITIKK